MAVVNNKDKKVEDIAAKLRKKREEREGRVRLESTIGLDTFSSDLNTTNSTLSGILGGWQSSDTMNSTKADVEKMYNRLGAYEDYRKNYGDNSLTDLSELLGAYESTLGGWDDLTFNYNRYKNVDEYNEAQTALQKAAEETKKMETEDLGVVKTEIGQLEELLKNAEAHESKIKGLENRKNTWEHRSRGLGTDGGYSDKIKVAETEYSDFLSSAGYTSYEEVKKALEDKKVYLSKAELLQNKALLASVADINSENYDKDFEKYAEAGKAMGSDKKSFLKQMSDGGFSENDVAYYREHPELLKSYEENYDNNLNSLAKSAAMSMNTTPWAAKYMTDEEYKIYNYYYGKGDKESAEKYLDSIKEDINNRQGYDMYKDQKGVFEKFAFGYEAGIDQFKQGVTNAFNFTDDYIPASPTQVASSWVREDIRQNQGAFGQGVYDLTTTTANMLPSVLASTATNIIAPGVGSYVGAGLMGLSASGNAYQEMLNLGYSKGQARNYSVLVGASEAALEKVLGGISALGGQTTARLTKVLSKVDNGLARFALNVGASALSEGFEEGLQEVLTPIFKDIAVGVDTGEEVNWDEVVYSALLGAVSGGLMESGPLAVSSVQQHMGNVATGKDLKAAEQVGNVFDIVSMSPEESEAYEAYTRYSKKGITAENISNAKLGNLYNTLSSEVNPTYMSALNDMGKSRIEIAQQKSIRESETSSEKQKSKATAKLDKAISNYNEAQTTIGKYGERFFKLSEVANKVSNSKYMAEKKAEAKKISADVETSVMAESNEAVDFKGVKFDGKDTKIITNDGEVSINDVKLSEIDSQLITIAKDMDANVASAFVSAYDRSSNVDIDQYLNDFNLVAGYAVNERYTPDYILQHKGSLSAKQVTSIYENTVIAEARKKEAEFNKLISTTANNTPYKGIIDDSIFKNGTVNYNRLDKRQKKAVEFLRVFASKSGMNLTFTPESKYYNGYFDRETNTIYVSVGAGIVRDKGLLKDTIIPTASHEITHWMEEKSPELWEKLKNVALDTLAVAKNQKQEDIIASEVERLNAKHPGKKHTADDAVREIVAKCCEDMLSMSEEGKKMFDTMSEAEQKTFKEKVMEIINNLKEWINEFLSSYGTQTEEAKLLRNYKDKLEEMSKIWDEMLVRSIEVNQALEKADAFNHLENGISEDGTTIVGKNNLQMSDKTYREGGRDFLVNWLDAQEGISEKEKWDIVEQTDRVAELMRAIDEGGELPDYSNWANMEVVKDENGEKVLSVIVKNGDYSMNIDFSQVCKKRVALDHVLNAMVQQGVLDVISLSESDMAELNAIIKKHDFEIACALCFVDAKRYRVNAWADSFCEGSDEKKNGKMVHKYGFNEMVRSLVPEGSKLNIDEFNFTNRNIKNQPTKNLLSEADDSDLDFSLIDKIMSENDSKSAQYRYAKAIKENPDIRKILNSSEIISSIGLDTIRLESPKVYGLINGHQGTAKPKFAHSMVAYGNDVLKASNFTPESAKMVGGVRCQSFSDFIASMVVDYAQFISELAAKKLTSHSYTKEPLFVKLFGLTGMKINMSLVPKAVDMTPEQQKKFAILKDKNANKRSKEYKEALAEYEKLAENAGLDENGNYIWEDETFPYDIAMEIVTDRRYSKNCGTIAVGISNNHIRKLLADDRISMVIPYHKSGLNHEVAMMRDIALYHDYTDVQNTRDKKTGSKLDKKKGQIDFDFYGDLYGKDGKEGTHDPKQTAQNYLAWCDENNYIPKFDEFALNPNYYKLLIDFRVYDVDGTYVEQQPVQAIYPSNEEFNDLILNGVKDKNGKVYGGLKQQQETSDRLNAEAQQIVAEFKQRLAEKYGEDVMQFSDKVAEKETELYTLRYEKNQVDNEIRKMEQGEEYKTITNNFIEAVLNGGDAKDEQEKYMKALDELGYTTLKDRLSSLESKVTELTEVVEKDKMDLERKNVEKSGLSEADYFRKQAVKEFGYTPFFYDAGYIVPNGKMLNFSGEKGKHFGTRGEDHRAIGRVYQNVQGSQAMLKFMGEGNVRIIAESPGIDISSSVEPTKEQYATIRKFVREYAKEKYFNIDITDENGQTIGNYEYEGAISADRVVNDIKYFFENGTTRERSSVSLFHTIGDDAQFSDKEVARITEKDIEDLRSIGRKSVNKFTSEDIKKAEPFARRMFKDIGIKSPFFRSWFGEWRQNDTKTSATIVDVPTIEIDDVSMENGDYIISDTGWVVHAGTRLKGETEHYARGKRISVKALTTIEKILNNAILLDTEVSLKDSIKKEDTTFFMHKLYAPIRYDGVVYIAKVSVEEFIDTSTNESKRKAYHLRAIKIETADGWSKDNNESSYTPRSNTVSIDSISDLVEFVKTYDKEFNPKEPSKVVNADKTPKIVYHGTDKDFNTFLPGIAGGIYFAGDRNVAEKFTRKGKVLEAYLDIKKPFVVDALVESEFAGMTFYKQSFYYEIPTPKEMRDAGYTSDTVATEEIVKYAKASGKYDGIIIENVRESDGDATTDYIVFNSTQVKSATDNVGTYSKFEDNFQYSDKDTTSVYDVMGETERLRAENEQLRKDFADLQERLELEKQLTHGNHFNENSLGTVAGHLRNISNSSYDKVSLIGRLKEVYSYIAHSENVTWDEMFDMSYRIAEDMLKESKPDVVVNREYKRILNEIRNTKISLDATQISEAKYRFGNHYNRAFFNKVHLTSEGISLDTMWQDWAERYPDFFDASVSSGNQIGELYDIIESLQEASEIVEEYDMEEQARWLATEIYNQYWNVSTIKTTADKYDRKIKLLNYQHRNRMNALRESYNERLEKQKLASEIHYGKLYNKRIGKIYNKLREQKEAEVAHARELGKQRMAEYKESIERKTVMQSMMGTVMSLNKKLTTNSKDVHIPEDLKPVVINLLNAIDFSSKQLLEMDGTKKSKRGTPTKTDLATENALSKVHSLGSEEASVSSLKRAVMDALELFEKAEKVLSEASDGTVDNSVVTLDVDMIDSIKKMIKELDILEKEIEGRFTLQAMRTDQLKTLNRMVKSINHWAIVADKALANKHKERISDLALQTIKENNVYGERQEYIKAIEDVKNFLNWSNVLPVNAFKRLGGAATRFFDSLRDSQDKLTFNRQEIMDFTDALFKGHKIKEWRTDVKEFTIKLPNGKDENGKDKTVEKTVRMPISYIMSLYCVSKQEDAKRHLLGLDSNGNRLTYEGEDKKIHDGGGITISGFKDGKLKVSKNLENTIISEDIIKQITSVLTNEQKDIADKLQEYMNSKGSEWGNAVSEALYGIKKFDVENYFPITVSPHTVHSDQTKDKRSASFFSIINYGFSKERNPNAKQSIEISDIFDVFANHMNMVAIYNAYALSMYDIARWHNFKGKGADKEELSVTKSIEKAFGKGATTYLSNLIKDLNGQHESSRLSFISALFKNAKVAMVGNSFSVTLLQPTAYFRAMTSIPPKYLLKAALHVKDFGAKNGVAKAKKYCGIALLKSQGYFETGVSANTTTKMLHDESFKEKAIEVSLKGAEWMDERTWGLLWNACEFEIRAERKDLKVGSEEFFEVVGEKLRDVIYETQVVDSPLTKSDIMRSPDMGAKSVTMFASEMTISYNMVLETVYDTVLDYKKNGKEGIVKRNGKRIVMVLTAQALTSTANAIATTAVQALRDDDDEEKDIEAYLSAFLSNFASDILIVGKIPYFKDTISFYQGFSSSRPESLWLESAFKAYRYIDKLVKGDANEDTLRRAIDELLKTGSYFSGYAAYNAWRELRAILNKIGIL